jgi:hypothetical protein
MASISDFFTSLIDRMPSLDKLSNKLVSSLVGYSTLWNGTHHVTNSTKQFVDKYSLVIDGTAFC